MKTQIKQPETVSHTIQHKTRAANQAHMHTVLQKYAHSIENGELRMESVQRQADDELDDELLQGKFDTAQRQEIDEDELLQGKFETAQREALPDEDELLQGKFSDTSQRTESQLPPSGGGGATGIPDTMKSGFENMSGFSFDDVRVHYNSSKPAQLQALAYTQGSEVHIAPGQEKHLGHELGHVVQQKQGRVQPTMQLQGVNVNDDEGLEREASEWGKRAVSHTKSYQTTQLKSINDMPVIQMTKWRWTNGCKWIFHEDSQIKSPPPSMNGIYTGEIVDTAIIRVVYAAGSRVNEANRATDHPERTYDVSDIQTEESVRRYSGYNEAAKTLDETGAVNRHGIDATTDTTPSVLTHIPFLETGIRDRERGPLTRDVMKDIFAKQNGFQPEGHVITIDLYIDDPRFRFGRRYGILNAVSGTDYKYIKRLKLNRKPVHVKTKGKGDGIEMNFSNTRRLFWVKDSSKPSQTKKAMRDVPTDGEDASDYEDELIFKQQAQMGQVPIVQAPEEQEKFDSWREAREARILSLREKQESYPNAYYYRHLDPGEVQKNGPWSKEEERLFIELYAKCGGGTEEIKWGLFSCNIPGRVGYQCANFCRQLVSRGIIIPPPRLQKLFLCNNCLIRAIYNALNVYLDEPTQIQIRQNLLNQGLAQIGEMLSPDRQTLQIILGSLGISGATVNVFTGDKTTTPTETIGIGNGNGAIVIDINYKGSHFFFIQPSD